MNLLIFAKTISPLTETFVYNYIVTLSTKVNVKVLCLARINEETFPLSEVNVLSRRGHWLKDRLWNKGFYYDASDSSIAQDLDVVIKSFQPDAVLCFFIDQAMFILDNLKGRDLPVFIMGLGYDASKLLHQSPMYRYKLGSILERKNVFLSLVSEGLRKNLKKYQINANNVLILPLCADTAFYKPEARAENLDRITTFIQVSSFEEKKGHIYTLKAFSRLKKQKPKLKFRLILVGGGTLLGKMKQAAIDLDIDKEVIFKGWCNKVEVKSLLRDSNVFVHHSITTDSGDTEGMPTAIVEAMAMELPIVSTYHSGIPEVVTDGENGILVRERDIEGYVAALEQLFQASKFPQNRLKISLNFSLQKQSELLLEWLHNNLPKNNKLS